MNHTKFVNYMRGKKSDIKFMSKEQYKFNNLRHAIENNAYDGINVTKLLYTSPKLLNKRYKNNNNILHFLILNYNIEDYGIFNYILKKLKDKNLLHKFYNENNSYDQTPIKLGFDLLKLRNVFHLLFFIKTYVKKNHLYYVSSLYSKMDITRLILLLNRYNVPKHIVNDCIQKLDYPIKKVWNNYVFIYFKNN